MSYPSPFDYFGAGGYSENDPNNGFSYQSTYDRILIDNAIIPEPSRHWDAGDWARLTQVKDLTMSARLDITVAVYGCIAGYCRNRVYVDDMVNPIWEKTGSPWSVATEYVIPNVYFSRGIHTLRFEIYMTHEWNGRSIYPDPMIGIIDYAYATNPIIVGDTVLLIPNYGDIYDRAAIKGENVSVGDNVTLHSLKGGAKIAIKEEWGMGDKIIF